MVGHYRPVFLGFARGGKAVATGLGAALAVAPLAAVCVAGIWGAVFIATRYSSIASLASCVAMPLLALTFGATTPVLVFLTAACTAVIVFHRKNVGRLLRGTENRVGFSAPSVALGRPARSGHPGELELLRSVNNRCLAPVIQRW